MLCHDLVIARGHFRPEDVVLVDLPELPEGFDGLALEPILRAHQIWLVTDERPVWGGWLELSRSVARVIYSNRNHPDQLYRRIVGDLLLYLAAWEPTSLAACAVQLDPRLRRAVGLVTKLLEHPWEIRRPNQLAESSGMSMRRLKKQSIECGFDRVEHLITCARFAAAQALIRDRPCSASAARRIVGVEDPSNFRRQLGRARSAAHPSAGPTL